MPRMPDIGLTPPTEKGGIAYLRLLVTQLQRAFSDTRTTVNELARDDAVFFTMDSPKNGTYPVGLMPSNRIIQGVYTALGTGTCDAKLKYGVPGSGTTIDWDGRTPADTIPVTTTITQDLPTLRDHAVAEGEWVAVELANTAGSSGLGVTVVFG